MQPTLFFLGLTSLLRVLQRLLLLLDWLFLFVAVELEWTVFESHVVL